MVLYKHAVIFQTLSLRTAYIEAKWSVPIRVVKTGQKIAYYFLIMMFLCKNLDNITRGPQRTVHNHKKRQFMTPLKLFSAQNTQMKHGTHNSVL